MAFGMDGEFVIAAARKDVWAALNDPNVLCRCIQGCQTMERAGEDSFAAEVKMKIGPVSSVFKGKVDLLDLDPPNSYRIEGKGDGGAAGFAKGSARVALSDVDGGTLLRYDVNADIGGRLAQLGGRLINGIANKQADQFFENFAAQFEAETAVEHGDTTLVVSSAPSASTAIAAPPSAPWVWFIAVAVAIVAGFVLGRSEVAEEWVVAMSVLALVSAGAGFRAGRQ
jgi:uncharacterized protein